MKKFGITTIVLAIVVIAILAIGYLAVIGLAKAAPDVGPSTDPRPGGDRVPVANGNIFLTYTMSSHLLGGMTVTINELKVVVNLYDGSQTLQVWENQKLDPLGLFGGSTYKMDIKTTLTGPGAWTGKWNPDTFENRLGTGDSHQFTKESGTMTFWDKGTYSGTLEILVGDQVTASKSFTWTV